MRNAIPIWHPDGAGSVFLRLRLRLSGPCRGGEVRCVASGPFHLFIGAQRVGGGLGGLLLARPVWQQLSLSGSWDSGDLDVVVVADQGPSPAAWFWCRGHLSASDGGQDVAIDTGIHWQGRVRVDADRRLPGDGAGSETAARQMALDAPGTGDDWQGVVAQALPAAADAGLADVEERLQEPATLVGLGVLAADAPWTSTALEPLTDCKCVHHDALLTGGYGAARVRTAGGRAVQIHLDLGRQICGWPALRLRHGRGGIIEMQISPRRDGQGHRWRYHCGSGRQEPAGMALVQGRFLALRFTGFDGDDVLLERVGLLERCRPLVPRGEVALDADFDAAWALGAASLDASRQEVYGPWLRPRPYDWLSGWILQCNDFAQTGDSRAARQALRGRAPEAPDQVTDWAYPLALRAYHLHTDDVATVDAGLERALRIAGIAVEHLTDPAPGWSVAAAASLALAGLEAIADIAALRGRSIDVEGFRRRCRGHLEPCWRADAGLYAEAPQSDVLRQWTNALALLATVDDTRAAVIERGLRHAGVEPLDHLIQAWVLAEALGAGGFRERLGVVIRHHWLRRLQRPGATWRDKYTAHVSGAVPGPDALLLRYLIGVRPLEPGWRTREVRPPLSQQPAARARVPLSEDESLSLAWSPVRPVEPSDSGRSSLAPPATQISLAMDIAGETHVRLERGGRRRPTITVNDEVVWRNEKIYPNPSVHFIAAEEEHVLLVLERPGSWRILLE